MSEREHDALVLLRRIYQGEIGKPVYDDDMVLEWIDEEIAAFIRKHGVFLSDETGDTTCRTR